MTQTQMQFCHQYRELSICVYNFAGPSWTGLKSVKIGCYMVVGGEYCTSCLHVYYVLLNNLRPSCCA